MPVKIFMKNAFTLGINLNTESDKSVTAFHAACVSGHLDMVKIFLENAAALSIDLMIKTQSGKTAFHLAAFHDHKNIVELMLNSAYFPKLDPQTFELVTNDDIIH